MKEKNINVSKTVAIEALRKILARQDVSLIVIKKRFSIWQLFFFYLIPSFKTGEARVYFIKKMGTSEAGFLKLLFWHFPHCHFLLCVAGAEIKLMNRDLRIEEFRECLGQDLLAIIDPLDEIELNISGSKDVIDRFFSYLSV